MPRRQWASVVMVSPYNAGWFLEKRAWHFLRLLPFHQPWLSLADGLQGPQALSTGLPPRSRNIIHGYESLPHGMPLPAPASPLPLILATTGSSLPTPELHHSQN